MHYAGQSMLAHYPMRDMPEAPLLGLTSFHWRCREVLVMSDAQYKEGDIVVIRAFDEFPEHLFEVDAVFDDCVSGYSLNGPLKGEYGEPGFELILGIHQA